MLDVKKTFIKVMRMLKQTDEKFKSSVIGTSSYTTSTSWVKSGNFTVSETGIYQIRSGYSNAGVLGIAYSLTQHTTIAQAEILVENTTAGSVRAMAVLYSGVSYSVWTKCATAGQTNSVTVTKLVNIYD